MGDLSREVILNVFSIIVALIISCIIWSLTIGTLRADNYNGIGSRTVFKSTVWGSASSAYTNLYDSYTEHNGVASSARMSKVWVENTTTTKKCGSFGELSTANVTENGSE